MSAKHSRIRLLPLLALLTLALGCGAEGDGTVDEEAGCRAEDTFFAEHCGETYCGAPDVEVGTGFEEFVELAEGDDVEIIRGNQGGYHVDISARMTRLCPIVYLRASVWMDADGDGTLTEAFDAESHAEAIRLQSQTSSEQEVWGVRAFIPCRHWPDTTLACSGGAGSDGHLEDFEVLLKLEAEDHNGRIATHERLVQPVCCES